MKKAVAILLIAVVVFTVVGCGMFGEKKNEKALPVGVYLLEVPEGEDEFGLGSIMLGARMKTGLEVVDGEIIKPFYIAAEADESSKPEDEFGEFGEFDFDIEDFNPYDEIENYEILYLYKTSYRGKDLYELITLGGGTSTSFSLMGIAVVIFYDKEEKTIEISGQKFRFSEEATAEAAASKAAAASEVSDESSSEDALVEESSADGI
jgi:3-polyprenyl-4-hydroxybenzoate decarboxylase and related decarboxylases